MAQYTIPWRRNGLRRAPSWRAGSIPAPRRPAVEAGTDLTQIAIAVRWGATCLVAAGVVASHPRASEHATRSLALLGLLGLYSVARTVMPVRATSGRSRLAAEMSLEATFFLALAAASGGWASPYLLAVGTALLLSGLLGGALPAVVGTATVMVAGAAAGAFGASGFDALDGIARSSELAMMAAVGAYVGMVFSSRVGQHAREVARLQSADKVNGLLLELHARAADQPGGFSLRAAVATSVARLQELLHPDATLLLLRDPTSEGERTTWQAAVADGVHLPPTVAGTDLPGVLASCATLRGPQLRAVLGVGEGLSPASRSGLYIPLWARSTLVGLLAVERAGGKAPFQAEDAAAVEEVAEHAGLAIDNARWFTRLRHLGAAEERDRIAREMHDRLGQSLAAIGLSLDRLAERAGSFCPGLLADGARKEEAAAFEEISGELRSFAEEVRSATAQVREKLTDLRSRPTASRGLVELLDDVCDRVGRRSGLTVLFRHDCAKRLPALIEQEMWRIAQEALANVERHARARCVEVSLRARGSAVTMEVMDDGVGMASSAPIRRDAFGLIGMRERAELIGASLTFDSQPGVGTAIRLRVPVAQR
ncbi:MAG TPA: GAF domain-containing sensor histidine kinase [Acidimicrobiales bacterium]|nr:GAF domain-containing sensor histidine kinase [Acidimicrobiales bacterium]